MAWAAAYVSRGFGYLFGAWLILTACLVVGVVTVIIDHAAANQFKIANVDLGQLAGPAAVPLESENPALVPVGLGDRLGPPVAYGATNWTVVSSRLIARTDSVGSRPIVVTEVVVANLSQDAPTRVRASDVALVWPDGHREEVDRFEFIDDRRVFSLEPGESLLVTLVFKPNVLANPDLAELTLAVGEQGRVPVVLPLLGRATPSRFPLVESIDAPPITVIGDSAAGSETTIVAERVSVDLNAGHYRAAVGERILTIDVTVANPRDGQVEGTNPSYRSPSFWRLLAGDETIDPFRVNPVENGVAILFVVDAESTDVVLTGGPSGSGRSRTNIALPGSVG